MESAAQPRRHSGPAALPGAGARRDGGTGQPAWRRRRWRRAALLEGLIAALNARHPPFTRELARSAPATFLPRRDCAGAAGRGHGVARGRAGRGVPNRRRGGAGPARRTRVHELNAFTAGHAALLVVDVRAFQDAWLAVAALSFEALRGRPVVLDARVQAAAGGPGQAAVAGGCGSSWRAPSSRRTRPTGRPGSLPVPGAAAGRRGHPGGFVDAR